MLNLLRRWLDELATGLFLLLALVATVLHPPVFATPGGLLLARIVLWSAGIALALLLIASRFRPWARTLLRRVMQFFPLLVAVIGYVGLRLLHAEQITSWLGIPSRDHWMMAADIALFGKTPCLRFSPHLLDSYLFQHLMAGFYGLYPLLPFAALGWFLFKRDMPQFYLVRRALLLSLYLGYCCYLLIPVAGPLSLVAAHPLAIDSTGVYAFLMVNFRYAYDCFPSLHTANPWLIAWLCRGKLPRSLMSALVVLCIGITFSTIALRQHYAIDDLAGLLWAALMIQLARATLPARIRAGATGLYEPQPAVAGS